MDVIYGILTSVLLCSWWMDVTFSDPLLDADLLFIDRIPVPCLSASVITLVMMSVSKERSVNTEPVYSQSPYTFIIDIYTQSLCCLPFSWVSSFGFILMYARGEASVAHDAWGMRIEHWTSNIMWTVNLHLIPQHHVKRLDWPDHP